MKLAFLVARVRWRLLIMRRRKNAAADMIKNLLQRTTQSVPIKNGVRKFLGCVIHIQRQWRNHLENFNVPLQKAKELFEQEERKYLAECANQAGARRPVTISAFCEENLARANPGLGIPLVVYWSIGCKEWSNVQGCQLTNSQNMSESCRATAKPQLWK